MSFALLALWISEQKWKDHISLKIVILGTDQEWNWGGIILGMYQVWHKKK